MGKVWFDIDCEMILSMIKDLGSDCGDMYCNECSHLINEVTRHKQDKCTVVYVEEERIKTINLMIRDNGVVRKATVEDLEKVFLKDNMGPNFARALAKLYMLPHKVIK